MPRDINDKVRDSDYPSLYRAPINLWVEDRLTRDYLSSLWGNDPQVRFLVGGGSTSVNAILKDAEVAGYANVFGLVDGDSGRPNHGDWFLPGKTFRRFVLPSYEIENYLLDGPSLAGCRFNARRRTAAEIEAILHAEAVKQC